MVIGSGFPNLTGTEYLHLTGWPFFKPGIHLGVLITIEIAIESASASKDFTALQFENVPSFSTTATIMTIPDLLFFRDLPLRL